MQPREVVPLIRRLRDAGGRDVDVALHNEAADALQTLAHDIANARMAETLIEAQDAEIGVLRAEHTALLELEKAVRAYGTSESATWTGVQRVLDELAKARDARATTERPEPVPQMDHEMSNPMNDPEEPLT